MIVLVLCYSLQHEYNNYLIGAFMLHYSVVFFVIAIIAAIFGFGGISSGATEIAKVLFFVFLAFTIVSFLFGRKR